MDLTGIGLYTFQEASKLTGVPARDLRRWLDGYAYRRKGDRGTVPVRPLWEPELSRAEIDGISFHDLLEVRFVRAFRQHGVSLQTIRLASEKARQQFSLPYPFTSRRFQTDGRTIFASAVHETGEIELLDLIKGQYAFQKIIEPSLYQGIDFGPDDTALRWYPSPGNTAVVLDPQIAFGKPIVTEGQVRTSILYASYLAENDRHFVANLHEVPLSAVGAAIDFEERLAA
ncbi:DUF433 domain-containing protein [Cupriavidus sp. UGS-1]|uniref:DUF433 domain-containing protein n=1 Tax=Cupriavidus sp. UGS-1 TaxID=2899826 RepID=UPI001E3BB945|nr:DUF433 domain-containing protein [Cupriavidus sp. UGS-1]